ncbi:MAG: hypothetical protein FJX35_09840 [Alphaproteobacteria bacterium]|nr:hypothetical protein [Alphaproteobacteria bacterium]
MTSFNTISAALNALIGYKRPQDLDNAPGDRGADQVANLENVQDNQDSAFEVDVPKGILETLEDMVKTLEASGQIDLSADGVRKLAHSVRDQLRDSGLSIVNVRPDSIHGLLRL